MNRLIFVLYDGIFYLRIAHVESEFIGFADQIVIVTVKRNTNFLLGVVLRISCYLTFPYFFSPTNRSATSSKIIAGSSHFKNAEFPVENPSKPKEKSAKPQNSWLFPIQKAYAS